MSSVDGRDAVTMQLFERKVGLGEWVMDLVQKEAEVREGNAKGVVEIKAITLCKGGLRCGWASVV